MIIYLITNTINGKRYVGQTRQTLAARWSQHRRDGRKNSPLYNAIRKHGAEAFKQEVLFTCDNRKTLNLYEKGHIEFFHTRDRNKGYNIEAGGNDGNNGMSLTPETRLKMSTAHKRRPPFSEEHRRNISKSAKSRPPVSEATCQKLAEAHLSAWEKGKYSARKPRSRPGSTGVVVTLRLSKG